jgi:uncharacterized surface protein with fasciclin (FAS1) repeats
MGWALAALMLGLLALPGCGRNESQRQPQPQPTITSPESLELGTAVAAAPGLASFAAALQAADFTRPLDSGAPYTLLAPTDAAIGRQQPAWRGLLAPANHDRLVDVLREHVVPGYLTPDKIETAISRNGGKPIVLKTAGEGSVTFARDGDALAFTSAAGMTAHLAGAPVRARNGVALPLDSVLVPLP